MTEPAPIIDFFSVKKVGENISNLRTEAASGLDGIGSLLLQELSSGLEPALTTIFTKATAEGIVPEENVTPKVKKGTKSRPGNYRPVFLTSMSFKFMESGHEPPSGLRYPLITPCQYSFVKANSCVTNLPEFLDKVTTSVDRAEAFDVVFLDFAKVFDKCHTDDR
jgi:hypothetical protein